MASTISIDSIAKSSNRPRVIDDLIYVLINFNLLNNLFAVAMVTGMVKK